MENMIEMVPRRAEKKTENDRKAYLKIAQEFSELKKKYKCLG